MRVSVTAATLWVWPTLTAQPSDPKLLPSCPTFPGSREAAFVYAISSAGVVYALTRACSQGELKSCNCDPHKRGREKDEKGEFDWGGCSDNINYGINFAKAFIDAKEKTGRDARALMNLHNNRCGRTVRHEPPANCWLVSVAFCSVVSNANVDM